MLYKFGKKSKKLLKTCHPDIQLILNEVIKFYDFSVISGLRTTKEQQSLFKAGRSKLDGINKKSKHQGKPDSDGNIVSYAVDIMPYKKGTNAFSGKKKDSARFYFLMGLVKGTAIKLLQEGRISHEVRFGLDWDGDDIFIDQHFDDLPHFELVPLKDGDKK
jgi:peptidoglycan L-alanyl-D-glutamate endopeptidase CwlK